MTDKHKILITVGATLLVVGLIWFGAKQSGSFFVLKKPVTIPESQVAASKIETGSVLGESENIIEPTNPLEGIYVNPFAE